MKKNIKGFTLLELMITISIFSLILGSISVFFMNEIKLYSTKYNDIELNQDGRIALDRVVSKIRSHNGLIFIMDPLDDTNIKALKDNSNIIINTEPNDPDGEINFYRDDSTGFGELRDKDRNRIVTNISDFSMTRELINSQYLIKIEVTCKNRRTNEEKIYTTSVRMYDY